MIISEDDQARVLDHLDKARNVLKLAKKGDERAWRAKREGITQQISAVFHNVQMLNTRPQ